MTLHGGKHTRNNQHGHKLTSRLKVSLPAAIMGIMETQKNNPCSHLNSDYRGDK
jgi:hypothetical protein